MHFYPFNKCALMKRIGLLLLCCSFQTFANEPPKCPDYRKFDIYVQNKTGHNCVLLSQTLRRGYTSGNIKTVSIQPNEKSLAYKTDGYPFQGSDVVLSYQCGPDKFITIESERDVWASDHKFVKGWIWSMASMDTAYTTVYGACDTNQSAQILWTFL